MIGLRKVTKGFHRNVVATCSCELGLKDAIFCSSRNTQHQFIGELLFEDIPVVFAINVSSFIFVICIQIVSIARLCRRVLSGRYNA